MRFHCGDNPRVNDNAGPAEPPLIGEVAPAGPVANITIPDQETSMPRIFITLLATAALIGAASAEDMTVCSRQEGQRLLSYTGGITGFRQNETFVREWVREAGTAIIGAPSYYDIQRFNGDDDMLTYDYAIDGRRTKAGAPEDDEVHNADGRQEIGAKAYIQTFWNRDDKTLMAHIICNDTRRPEGDCRIAFQDARRLGSGGADGPVVSLFLQADAPVDVCASLLGERGAWWLVLDGVKSNVVDGACGGADLAQAFASAGHVEAVMISPYDYNKGKEVTNTLTGPDIATARDLAGYVRRLNYAPSPDQTAWLEGLVAASKAAFAAAGDTLRTCTAQEPPT